MSESANECWLCAVFEAAGYGRYRNVFLCHLEFYPNGIFHFSKEYLEEGRMKMNTRLSKRTMNLVLAGVMIALGTVLNFIKFLDMPYGGSITLCSMLPIMNYAYK